MDHVGRKHNCMHANTKGVDQPAHQRSLVSAFVIRYLESIVSKLLRTNLNFLASHCSLAGWIMPYHAAKPENRFAHNEAHIYYAHGTVKQI